MVGERSAGIISASVILLNLICNMTMFSICLSTKEVAFINEAHGMHLRKPRVLKVRKVAKIRNRYNQVPTTSNPGYHMGK